MILSCAALWEWRRLRGPVATRGVSRRHDFAASTATSLCASWSRASSGSPFPNVIDAFSAEEVAALERQIDGWLAELDSAYDHIIAVDRSSEGEIRWYVRMRGEDKDFTTVWLTLGQRTLKYETYVMGAPEENEALLFEQLLRRNDNLVGAHFSVGFEDAVYLRGQVPASAVTLDELDRVLGTLYSTVEQSFRGLLRIGFASRFTG